MSKKVIFSIKGEISKRDQARLFGHGYLVVEVSDFSKIRFVSELESATEDDVYNSLLIGIEAGNYPATHRAAFGEELIKRLKQKIKKANP